MHASDPQMVTEYVSDIVSSLMVAEVRDGCGSNGGGGKAPHATVQDAQPRFAQARSLPWGSGVLRPCNPLTVGDGFKGLAAAATFVAPCGGIDPDARLSLARLAPHRPSPPLPRPGHRFFFCRPHFPLQHKYRPILGYIESVQRDINPQMRAILVDWLVEVSAPHRSISSPFNARPSFKNRALFAGSSLPSLSFAGLPSPLLFLPFLLLRPPTSPSLPPPGH